MKKHEFRDRCEYVETAIDNGGAGVAWIRDQHQKLTEAAAQIDDPDNQLAWRLAGIGSYLDSLKLLPGDANAPNQTFKPRPFDVALKDVAPLRLGRPFEPFEAEPVRIPVGAAGAQFDGGFDPDAVNWSS